MADRRVGKRYKNSREVASLVTDFRLSELINKYVVAKQAEGKSKATISQNNEGFKYFLLWLGSDSGEKDVRSITTDTVRAYVVYMMTEIVRYEVHEFKPEKVRTLGLKPSTINTRLKALRVFYKWLIKEHVVDVNPMENVTHVKEPEEDISILTPDQLHALLKVPSQRTYAGFRDYVLMTFLLDSMIRITEAVNLKISDFNAKDGTISIPGTIAKNRKYRFLPLSKETTKLLQELIKENQDMGSDYIFLANYGERLETGQVRNRLSQFSKKAGIPFNVHPHTFRHTGATLYLENGGSERYLQMLLGHATLRLISRYTHPSRKSLQENHEKNSPLIAVQAAQARARKMLREDAV